MNKPFAVITAFVVTALSVTATPTFELDSLTYYGAGDQRAAFVVDWNNGQPNHVQAFGYRFTGEVTFYDMLSDIAGDPSSGLYLRVDGETAFGEFIFGIGRQNGATPFAVSNTDTAPAFNNGVWDISVDAAFDQPASFGGAATNQGDFYEEGFDWGSYVAGTAPDFSTSISEQRLSSPSSWTATSLGAASIDLVDDGWYGFGRDSAPSTIPEPATFVLLFSGLGILLWWRRFTA